MNDILNGRRVLVVEDEMIVSMMIEDMLTELGCQVVGPATSLAQGLAHAGSDAIDIAILDVNLNGERSDPVARRLQARRIPFVYATGYGSDEIDSPGGEGVLQKPFDHEALIAVLSAILSKTAAP